MPFLKCKNCIVRSCCSEVCEEFKEYSKKTYNITIGNKISLNQVKIAFGNIEKVEINIERELSKAGADGTLFGYKLRQKRRITHDKKRSKK